MLRKYCLESHKDWDKGLPFLLFATRETPNESLGFSPFELLFTHEVRGPLKLLKNQWLGQADNVSLLSYVSELKDRLHRSWEVARDNLKDTQGGMKAWHDKKSRIRVFEPGDQVLVLLPLQGQPLQARFSGPYSVQKRVSEVNYVVNTPDRRKSSRLCHVNMLKAYSQRDPELVPVSAVTSSAVMPDDVGCPLTLDEVQTWEKSAEGWAGLTDKLSHFTDCQRHEFTALLTRYQDVFRDAPGRTTVTQHDVEVGDAAPVKQRPYRVGPERAALLQKELDYMLKQKLVEPCQSEWCSPVTLVPKPGGSYRFCIDYRKVNSLTKTDSYPLPRVEDCVDQVGRSKFISKFDLLNRGGRR